MSRLFVFFLFVWSLGALFFFLVALSDLAFARSFRALPVRLLLCVGWPLALFSSRGRVSLFYVFKQTQVKPK